MNRLNGILLLILFSCGPVIAGEPFEKQPEWVARSMFVAQTQAKAMASDVISAEKLPRSIEKGLRPTNDWTSGFYPGILWYLYEYTSDPYWKKQAETITPILKKEQCRADDHDIGFVIYCSFGNGWRLTEKEAYKNIIIQSAKTLSGRYSDLTRTIMSWSPNKDRDWEYPVIIDNMMNLELLLAASEMTGQKEFKQIALAHADRTMKDQYRADMSCPHVVDYDSLTGAFRKMDWNNGDDNPQTSEWSRGQAWGLYGYTMMYRETKEQRYLEHAENIARFILSHPNMPSDMVPYWDFSAPHKSQVRDASSAAIMASALMELSRYSKDQEAYFKAGEKMLQSLASAEYLAQPGTHGNFIIKHATGNYLRESEVDGALIYADYYFVEGLLRYLKIINDIY